VNPRALIVIDMLNTYEFEDADRLMRSVEEVLPTLRALIERTRDEGAPVIYVNDSMGDWRGDRSAFLEHLVNGPHPELVEGLLPAEDDLFITKARHSIFYGTALEYLLRSEDLASICLAGQVTEQCILYSALDAHIRHIPVEIPRDAVAHIHEDLGAAALSMMERNMEAEIREAAAVRFDLR
jgi:nicotinamidase-related amidase